MGSEAVKMKKFFKGDSGRPMEVNLKIKVELRGTLPYKPQHAPKMSEEGAVGGFGGT